MLARAIIPGTLFLAGSAIAAAVHPARKAITSVVVVTHENTQAFTSVIDAPTYTYEVTQPVATTYEVTQPVPTTYYSEDGVFTSAIDSAYTSAACYCPVAVSIPPQTSAIQEPITLTVSVEAWSSAMPDAEPSGTVDAVIRRAAVTSVVADAAVTSVIADAVTSSLQEPTPTTMVVTVLPSSSGFPGPVTMCGCAAASTSPAATWFASTTPLAQTASMGNNLLLNSNSNGAGTKVVSVQLVAFATFFGLVGAGFTLI